MAAGAEDVDHAVDYRPLTVHLLPPHLAGAISGVINAHRRRSIAWLAQFAPIVWAAVGVRPHQASPADQAAGIHTGDASKPLLPIETFLDSLNEEQKTSTLRRVSCHRGGLQLFLGFGPGSMLFRERIQGAVSMLAKLFAGSLLTGALSIQLAAAASIVTPSPTSGHPAQAITITGSGFGNSEAVDVYVDTTDTLLLISSATGTLTGSVTIPPSAIPGAHSVTAIGRRSGDAAQATLTVSTPWTKFAYGAANLGLNPYENVLSPSTVPSLGTLWNTNIGATGGTPIIANNHVYVGTSTGVAALNATTGATLWNKNLGAYFNASPTLVGSTLYVGDRNGNFYALNANTGATIWMVAPNSGGFYGSAAVANGIIYVGGANGTFFALKAAGKGQVLWSYSVGGEPITVTPALANGDVYFAAYTNYIYCLDGATGALVWKYQTGNAIDSSPAIANGLLYIGAYDDIVYAIGTAPANAGQLVWSYTTGGAVVGSPTVANGYVYIGSDDGNFYALNSRTGAVYFSLATGANAHSAITANGVIYFTTSFNTAYAVSTYGSVLASGSIGNTFLGSPAVSDGRLFIATTAGAIYAFAPNAGTDIVRTHAPRPSSLHPDMGLPLTR